MLNLCLTVCQYSRLVRDKLTYFEYVEIEVRETIRGKSQSRKRSKFRLIFQELVCATVGKDR